MSDPTLNVLTSQIIACAIAVHRALGPGLLESAYSHCLVLELRQAGLKVECNVRVPIFYRGVEIECGYRLDLLVENLVIIELKAIATVLPVHEAQLLTYLKLTGKPLGLLLNFNVPVMKEGIVRRINTPLCRQSGAGRRPATPRAARGPTALDAASDALCVSVPSVPLW